MCEIIKSETWANELHRHWINDQHQEKDLLFNHLCLPNSAFVNYGDFYSKELFVLHWYIQKNTSLTSYILVHLTITQQNKNDGHNNNHLIQAVILYFSYKTDCFHRSKEQLHV